MSTARNIELANIHLTLGDLELLDVVEDIVLPALVGDYRVRSYGQTDYYLIDTDLITLEGDGQDGVAEELAVVGRLVKNTTLSREQVFDRKTHSLIRDHLEVQSAPSSVFVLLLGTHRLIYLPEVSHAPTLDNFRSTITYFLKLQRRSMISHLHKNQEHYRAIPGVNETTKVTKKLLLKELPPVTLDVVPLASKQNFKQFVDRFETLKSIELQLIHRNHEYDPNELFEAIDEEGESLGSDRSRLRHSNAREGLNKVRTKTAYEGHAERGNARVKMDGVDANGDRLIGNNEDFRLKVPFEVLSDFVTGIAKHMHQTVRHLQRDGVIELPSLSSQARNKLKSISKSRNGNAD